MAKLLSGTRIYGNLTVDTWANISGVYIGSGSATSGLFWAANNTAISFSGGSGTYGNAQVLANLAAASNPVTFGSNIVAASGTTSTSTTTGALIVNGGVGITGNLNASNVVASSGFTMGSQVFYAQGTNGFSVNENYDPSNNSGQTAYHFTSGATRANIAFTLARTGQFTDGFGVYGTSADNTFVTFGEQSNTSFEWRKGIGIQPLNLSGGTQLMKLSSAGNLVIPTATTSTSSTTGALVVGGGVGVSGNVYSGNLNIGGLAQAGLSITSSLSNRTASIAFIDQYNLDINPGAGYLILSRGNQNIGLGGNTSPAHRMSLTGDAYMSGNLTTLGNVTIGGITTHAGNVAFDGQQVTHYDSIIDLHTYGNLAAWSSDDGKDIGLRLHYYNGVDSLAFVGLENSSKTLQFLINATEVSGNVTGTFGNAVMGSMLLSNTTTSTSTTTGALQVAGGAGIVGNVFAGSLYDNGVRVVSTSSGAGNLSISGTAVTLPATGPGAGSVGSSTAIPVITTDAYGRIASTSIAAVVAPAGTLSGSTLAATVTGSSLTSVGTLTGLTVSGVTSITNGTASTNSATGARVVTGGVGIGGNLWVGGNIYAANVFGVNQDVITIQDPLIYLQALGNLSNYNYDIGFYSDYSAPGYRHTGLARSFASNIWTFFSNLASEPDVAGINWNDAGIAYDTVRMGQLLVANTTASTSTTTGALQVAGGAGIVGSAYIGGGVQNTPIGNATPNTGAFTTLSATGASTLNTVTGASFQGIVGNASATTAFFTTVNATTVQAATIGNTGATFSGNVGTFTGNVTAGNLITAGSNGNISGVNTVFASTINATTLIGTLAATSVNGTVATANVSLYDSVTALSTNATFYPQFSNISTTGNSITGVNSSLTYNPGTGALSATSFNGVGTFSTATTSSTFIASGNIVAGSGVASTSTSTGALVVTGGVGISGALNVGGVAKYSGGNIFLAPYSGTGGLTINQFGIWNEQDSNNQLYQLWTNGSGTTAGGGGGLWTAGGGMQVYSSAEITFTMGRTLRSQNYPTGGTNASQQNVTFSAAGQVTISNNQQSTSTSTGALVVTGGAGISGNIWSGNVLASGFFYSNGTPFSSSNYGNVQMLANLAATGNPVTFNSNVVANGNLIVYGNTRINGSIHDVNGNIGLSGQVLSSLGGGGTQWVTTPSTLAKLTDVNLSAPAVQQVLTYNGSQWVNADSTATVASAVFASSQYDMGLVTDATITVSEDEGSVTTIAATIYDLGVMGFTGVISLNNIDQSIKSDYLGYSIIFGF